MERHVCSVFSGSLGFPLKNSWVSLWHAIKIGLAIHGCKSWKGTPHRPSLLTHSLRSVWSQQNKFNRKRTTSDFFMFFEKSRRLLFYRHVFSLPLPVSYWSRLNQECGKPASSHKGDRAAGIRKSTFLKKNIWEGEEVATSRMSYVWITEHPKHMAKSKSVQREREPCNFIPGSYIFRFFSSKPAPVSGLLRASACVYLWWLTLARTPSKVFLCATELQERTAQSF